MAKLYQYPTNHPTPNSPSPTMNVLSSTTSSRLNASCFLGTLNSNSNNDKKQDLHATLLHASRMRRRLQRQVLIQIDQEQSALLQSQRSFDFTNTISRSCTIPINENEENNNDDENSEGQRSNDDASSCTSSLTSCLSDDS